MALKKIDYSVILAAGKGTRFHSSLPKVLHKISGLTLLERSIRAVAPYTNKDILVVAGHGYDLVKEEIDKIELNDVSLKIKLVLQKDQLGTGHAAQVALDQVDSLTGSVLIIPGDCPLIESQALENFVNLHSESPLSVLTLKVDDPFGFGRIIRDNEYISSIVEEKDASQDQKKIQEINSSIFLGDVKLLKNLLPSISNNNKQNEYYLTDVVAAAVTQDVQVGAFVSEEIDCFLGANTRKELYMLQVRKKMKDLNLLMEKGVTFEFPESCSIDENVEIGKDVFIGANTRILGNSKIADGVIIEGDSLIRDSQIGVACHLKLGSYIDECIIEDDCTLGPFVHIRPKSHLKKNVKIGNFVEVKASTLEEGVKANHLAYLGDIDIGQKSNIGAGTIICNYDGINKFRSNIGKKSFVGSNSTIVSPVKLGDDVYVAAGSVITKDVVSGSLGIGRSRQVNKEGWVTKKK
jgi:bifunctional UDP-N-acetylglucosamine pyrophosphorylase/glucosamine-1-phosphate N-acetyltransferase